MAYTKEEIAAFDAKDKRINRVAICKSLIESKTFTKEEILNETEKIFAVAERFVTYVYNGVNNDGKKEEIEEINTWVKVAQLKNLIVPTDIQQDILDKLWEEYKSVCPKQELKNLSRAALLESILLMSSTGTYPSKDESIKVVLQRIKLASIINSGDKIPH